MPVDLLNFDPHNPDLHQMYAWATCLRVFRNQVDGRNALWSKVPGVKSVPTHDTINVATFNGLSVALQHCLVELEDGWLSVFGGTEAPYGWPYHAYSVFEPPTSLTEYFPAYWYITASQGLADIATVVPTNDSRPICFVGHSLGGATAVAAAFLDHSRSVSRKRTAATFGAPLTRAASGMSGHEFDCCRLMCIDDVVPCLPQHLVKVALTLGGLARVPLFSLYHYGLAITIDQDGLDQVGDYNFLKYGTAGIAWTLLQASLSSGWQVWHPHYMVSYAMRLRKALVRRGVQFDPVWDEINAFCNEAEGWTWNIPGFPAANPPAQTIAPPTPVNLDPLLAAAPNLTPFTADLLNPRPLVPVIENQSLAGFLNSAAGTTFEDVLVMLSQAPVPDPTNVDLSSFTPATFSGYSPAGGPIWVTAAAPSWTPARPFAARALFSCIGAEQVNTIYAWYMVGIDSKTGLQTLIDWAPLGNPFTFDRPRTLVVEMALAFGPI